MGPSESSAAISIKFQLHFTTDHFPLHAQKRNKSKENGIKLITELQITLKLYLVSSLCFSVLQQISLSFSQHLLMYMHDRVFPGPASSGGNTDCRNGIPLLQKCWRRQWLPGNKGENFQSTGLRLNIGRTAVLIITNEEKSSYLSLFRN